jgi:hypothetical protein
VVQERSLYGAPGASSLSRPRMDGFQPSVHIHFFLRQFGYCTRFGIVKKATFFRRSMESGRRPNSGGVSSTDSSRSRADGFQPSVLVPHFLRHIGYCSRANLVRKAFFFIRRWRVDGAVFQAGSRLLTRPGIGRTAFSPPSSFHIFFATSAIVHGLI